MLEQSSTKLPIKLIPVRMTNIPFRTLGISCILNNKTLRKNLKLIKLPIC